jgi:putative component of toxin-antitoxin plasmid stabilization module
MYARIALSVVLAAAFCAPSSASRKFTGSESVVYESENPIVEGLGEFGLSAWILVRDDGGDEPSTQGIIDNLRTPDGNGFTLYYERADKVRSVVFRYQGDLSSAKSGLIETRANLGMTQIGKWIHVAADLSLTTAMKTKARIWINGRPGKV